MLGGKDHRLDAGDLAVLVAQRDLALGIGPEPRKHLLLAHLGLLLDQAVGEVDGRRHERRRLRGGVAEHQPLVACALIFGIAAIHALRDVRRLLADHVDHRAGGAVEAELGGVIADVEDHPPHELPRGSTQALVVTSPAMIATPVLTSVSQATRALGSWARMASSTASEIWSAILSGWPSLTDSEVKRKLLIGIES